MGILSKDQGVDLLIEGMPQILQNVPNSKLVIIGSGDEAENLKKRVKDLRLEKYVEFKGFVKDNEEVNRILLDSNIGVAPYLITKNSYKYYTDPGKIKTYLGAGLPVVMTNISHIAKVIKDKEAGIVVEDQIGNIANGIIKMLSDKNYYLKLHRNAISLSKEYSWENIYKKAFLDLAKV